MPEQAPPPAPEAKPSNAVSPDQIFRADHFRVEIEGIGSAQFVEIGGLAVKVAAIPFRGGGEGQIVHQLPGQIELAPLQCRYGVTSSPALWQWMQASMRGEPDRRNLSVIYLDTSGKKVLKRWNLSAAWPCEFSANEFHSMKNHVAIDTMKVVYEMIERV